MNWAWATSLDDFWRSPMLWLTVALAVFFAIILVATLVRGERSAANGGLALIAVLALGIAAAATSRGLAPASGITAETIASAQLTNAALPALSCIDDLAGETVLAACEKALFGSAESVAAAVSYAASQISHLTAIADAATANRSMTPELQTLRRAVERDRYGLMAQALAMRDGCSPSDCPAFRALTDKRQIATNMDARVYDSLVARYAPLWNAPPAPAAVLAAGPGGLPASLPTGKPTTADFPSAASTPAVSIMSAEPSAAGAQAASPARPAASAPPATTAPLPAPRPAAASAPVASVKKPAAQKQSAAPVQLTPAAAASAPEASNND